MKRIGFYLASILLACMFSCDTEPKFTVTGNVSDADGKTIILEAMDINGTLVLDSTKLKKKGNFKFSHKQPESPEFYRLRIDNKIINFSVDSTETITINAPFDGFTTKYTVEGSENSSKIKELTLLQMELQQKVDAVTQSARNNQINMTVFGDSLNTLIDNYKNNIKRNYIFAAPNKAYSYFALFQKVNNYMIFDALNNKDDVKAFAAVATSLNNAYPHADRSRNLYNMAIKGMKNTRTPQQKVIDVPEVNESGVIDIALKDIKGNTHKLTDLKGKVVLLDFTVYQNPVSISHNFMLRELYDKYAGQGLEIYQVSLDADEHFWKTTADNLPWISVRDPEGVYSRSAAIYNVQQVPTYFLVNRNNELSARDETIKNLESEIKKLL